MNGNDDSHSDRVFSFKRNSVDFVNAHQSAIKTKDERFLCSFFFLDLQVHLLQLILSLLLFLTIGLFVKI